MSSLDVQVDGDHYKSLKIQPMEYAHANDLDWYQGEIVKYITRFRNKGGKKDLEKIIHLVQVLIELEYPDTTAIGQPPPRIPTDVFVGGQKFEYVPSQSSSVASSLTEPPLRNPGSQAQGLSAYTSKADPYFRSE
jgi:hypothetical protein